MAFASSRIGAQEAIIIPCDICEEEEEVNWFCKDCGQNMCNRCKKFHLRTANSRNHELLSISEGFVIGKENVQNMCNDHTEVFSFHCRTCKKNICTKCLSQNHKKHDFVALREVQEEVQRKLLDILKRKGEEMEIIAQNIGSLSRFKKDFYSYIAACYVSIDKNVQAVKVSAESEGEKLKSRLAAIEGKKKGEIDQTEQSLIQQKDEYAKKISDTERGLRMQTNITLSAFAERSESELLAMTPTLAKIPADIALFSEGKLNTDHISDMIGRIDEVPETVLTRGKDSSDVRNPVLRKEINVVGNIGDEKIFPRGISSVCSSHDGNMWIGTIEKVLKVDISGNILAKIDTRKGFGCCYMAGFTSGDAIVSYGYTPYIDRFTSDGRRIDFADMSPGKTYAIIVTDQNQVVVNVNNNSLVMLSEQGQKLREIKPDVKPFSYFCLLQDGSYKIAEADNQITVDGEGKVTRRQKITKSDVSYMTCDHYGNAIASNNTDSVYVINGDGEVVRTYQIPGKKIGRLAVDNKGRLLMVTGKTITVADYILS